jgi:hypothetical protein
VIKAAEAHLKTLSSQPGYAIAVLKVRQGLCWLSERNVQSADTLQSAGR